MHQSAKQATLRTCTGPIRCCYSSFLYTGWVTDAPHGRLALSVAGLKRRLTEFTQWRSSVGVGKPSPLNTWPRWPPHLEHRISTRLHTHTHTRQSRCTRTHELREHTHTKRRTQQRHRNTRTRAHTHRGAHNRDTETHTHAASPSVSVLVAPDRARDTVIESRPATAAAELGRAGVQSGCTHKQHTHHTHTNRRTHTHRSPHARTQ